MQRVVPLRSELVSFFSRRMDAAFARTVLPECKVFPEVPTYEVLLADFVRAGIDHRDREGRVVHFHAFRKTVQTMGGRAGVGQRSAQAILGHSDPSLTANVYTDEQALALGAGVAKLPWIGDTQLHSQTLTKTHKLRPVSEIVAELIEGAKALPESELCGVSADSTWLPGSLRSKNSWNASFVFRGDWTWRSRIPEDKHYGEAPPTCIPASFFRSIRSK